MAAGSAAESPAAALIVAAGSGRRLGADRPKALVELGGRPMFEWSLKACRAAGRIGPIVIAAPPGQTGDFAAEDVEVVEGGATRSQSVAAGLEPLESDLVLVHDAARPLVTPGLIDAAVAALEDSPDDDAVIAAAPVTDTIKRVDQGGIVVETIDRSMLRAVQTPQVFRRRSLLRAIASGDLEKATDDAYLIESAGGTVRVLEAPSFNIKVTVPEDLAYAELHLGD